VDRERNKRTTPSSPTRQGATAAPPAASRIDALMNLQRQVGNQAIGALLGLGGDVIQRDGSTATATPPATGTPPTAPAVAAPPTSVLQVVTRLEQAETGTPLTATEANQIVAYLGGLGPDGLSGAVNRLGGSLLQTLLDGVDATGQRTGAYGRVAALAAGRGASVTAQLVWAGISLLPTASQHALLFDTLTIAQVGTLLNNAPSAVHEMYIAPIVDAFPRGGALTALQKTRLGTMLDRTPDAAIETLVAITKARFGIAVGAANDSNAAQWEATGLRRAYHVMEVLPGAHVEGNAAMVMLTRYTASSSEGWYDPSNGESAIGYDPARIDDRESGAFTKPGDPLFNKDMFNATVRHEVGHAVDQQLGWSVGSEPTKVSRGGWKVYGSDHDRAAKAIIRASDKGIQRNLSESKKADIRAVMVSAMQNGGNAAAMQAAIMLLPWWGKISPSRQASVMNDPALTAVDRGLNQVPWSGRNNPFVLGSYVFHESYSGDWVRTNTSAWGRKVSTYQFRAPGEWFAEAYAAYYEPAATKGAVLAERDPDTKRYFDRNVDSMTSSR